MLEKQCAKCSCIKPINEFVKDKNKKDGYRGYCKKCYNLSKRKTPIKDKPKEGFKICARCNDELLVSEFNIRKNKYFSYCKKCEHEYDKNKYKHVCENCGKEYTSGRKNSILCKECHTKIIAERGKKRFSELNKYKIGSNNHMYGVRRYGADNPNFNINKTDEEREKGRLIEGYSEFIKNCYERDHYTCQCCGDNKGGNLVVHHLDGYNWCREKRTDINNGITLCTNCHEYFHDLLGYGNNTKEQFYEFMKQYANTEVSL